MRRSVLPFLAALLLAGQGACDGVPRTGTSSQQPTERRSREPAAQPVGIPTVMEWDGVTRRILMRLIRKSPQDLDSTTYALSRNQWIKVPPVEAWPDLIPGQEIAMAYDSDRNREVVVFVFPNRGVDASPTTWNWDGKAWTQITTKHPLPYLRQPSSAYSPDLHAVVMIGHCNRSLDPAGDTLLFAGGDWRSVWTPNTPSCPAKLAYSRARHAIVAFSFADNRTWLFNGRDWLATPPVGTALASTSTSPPVGNGMTALSASVAFDMKRDTWVLFGGAQQDKNSDRTWTGEGIWTLRSPQSSPIARSWSGMVWDPRLDAIVLFGGFVRPPGPNGYLGDTWSWDGGEWHQLAGPDYRSTPPSAMQNA